ncbi:MAG: TIM barrel protein [Candidatus Pacebacteria bacterium]|nr:TIM barrel protein [Candidatus Paceibacterota bacterium]
MDKIKNIKFGLKTYSTNTEFAAKSEELIKNNLIDYLEVLPVLDSDITPFLKVDIPYIIHIPHEEFGLNISDKSRHNFSLKIIKEAQNWADLLKAKYLILHLGFGEIKNAEYFLKNINDKRILIENMPYKALNGLRMTGSSVQEVKRLKGSRFGFCLDFGHAVKSAIGLKKDYKEYIKEFLKIKPDMFHISDGKTDDLKDRHLSIGKGDYDFKFLLKCINENKSRIATLETPKSDFNSVSEDIENLKILKSFLNE